MNSIFQFRLATKLISDFDGMSGNPEALNANKVRFEHKI